MVLKVGFGAIASSYSPIPDWSAWNGSLDGSGVQYTSQGPACLSEAKLDTEKTIVAWSEDSGFSSRYIKAVITTSSGVTPTIGTSVIINNAASIGTRYVDIVALDSSRALVIWNTSENSIDGCILSISGTTITAGTNKNITAAVSGFSICNNAALTKVATDKAVIAYTGVIAGTSGMGAFIVTVTGTTINNAGAHLNAHASSALGGISICALDESRVLIGYSGTAFIGAICLAVGGSTLTAPSARVTIGTSGYLYPSVANVTADSAVIAYVDQNVNTHGYAAGMTLSGTTITAGTPAKFDSTDQIYLSANGNSLLMLNTTQLMVGYSKASTNIIYGKVITLSGTALSFGSIVTIGGSGNTTSQYTLSLIDYNRVLASYNATQGHVKILKHI